MDRSPKTQPAQLARRSLRPVAQSVEQAEKLMLHYGGKVRSRVRVPPGRYWKDVESMKAKLGKCEQRIGYEFNNFVRCSRNAVTKEGGKGYCKQHLPSYIEAKREARHKKWDAENERWNHEQDIEDARLAVAGAAKKWHQTQQSTSLRKFQDAVEKLIKLEESK